MVEEAEAFVGTWKIAAVENDDAFSKAIGLPTEAFKAAKGTQDQLRKTIAIESGGVILDKLFGGEGLPTLEEKFKLGVPFESRDLCGRPNKVTVKIEDGKWTEQRVGAVTVHVTKWVDGDKMIMESDCDGKVMKTTYDIC